MMNACRRWAFLALVVLTAAVVSDCQEVDFVLGIPQPQESYGPPSSSPICYLVEVGSKPASGDSGQSPQTNKVCFH
jgi:hypothetical protein